MVQRFDAADKQFFRVASPQCACSTKRPKINYGNGPSCGAYSHGSCYSSRSGTNNNEIVFFCHIISPVFHGEPWLYRGSNARQYLEKTQTFRVMRDVHSAVQTGQTVNNRVTLATARMNKPINAATAIPRYSPRASPAVVPVSTTAKIGRWQGQVSTAIAPHAWAASDLRFSARTRSGPLMSIPRRTRDSRHEEMNKVQRTKSSTISFFYPAQHESWDTSLLKVCAASFSPSTIVR